MEHLMHLNWLAVAVCAVIYFAIGGIWYSPLLFSKKWVELSKADPEKGKSQMPMMFANAFFCGALASIGIALLLSYTGITAIPAAIKLGLLCGGCFGFTSLSMSYTFGQRPIGLLLIDSFYHIISLVAVSSILCMWH